MQIIPLKTRAICPPQDDIHDVIDSHGPLLAEGDIFLITSKILAIHQGRCVSTGSIEDKDELIREEADLFIPREECPGEHVVLAIKNNTLIPSAGIDESNADGHYILWPNEPELEAKRICEYLKDKFLLEGLAVIITDSHTTPMRYGVMGISIGFYGLNPIKNYIGETDIFGRTIKMTKTNVVDVLAALGVLAMGEGDEQQPMAIIRGCDLVEFTNEEKYKELIVPITEDIYYPLLKKFYEQS